MKEIYGTTALDALNESAIRLVGFVGFVSNLVLRADKTIELAVRALEGDEAGNKVWTDPERKSSKSVMQENYSRIFLEMVVQRSVDDFLLYLARLLRIIFTAQPSALKSSETIRIEEILEYSSLDDLLSHIAERKVDRLAYKSVSELSTELERSLGLSLVSSDSDLRRLVDIVETRNLITHNDAIVNLRYIERTRSSLAEGIRIPLDVDDAFSTIVFLREIAEGVDSRAIPKFGLPSSPISLPD